MIQRLLVANRGEIACRILRACREADIETVAIFAPDDANSLFTEMADITVALDGETIGETYLDIEQILSVARHFKVDAIHPGYGFLSERSEFAEAVMNAGIIWVGPSVEAIDLMGDKMTARKTMKNAGVPVIPGEEIEGGIDAIVMASKRVGFPLLLKASAGGGGKGMRAVHSEDQIQSAAQSAQREALKAFGDDRIYVERLLAGSRHIEIQILADQHGSTIHLGERECSVQRRHQKVFEESPSIAVNDNLREAMGQAAINAAKAVDYVGAGTVEFLLSANGEFFFLEMNTRIQVEHPVTEMVTGVDLVREQIRIAQGQRMSIKTCQMRGHAIEVRLYAEDPKNNFLPAIGKLLCFQPPEGPGIRLDTGFREGDEVTPNYDPMLSKLIVWAPSREEALARMRCALEDFVVLGCVTNITFLRALCLHPDVITGRTTTDMIETIWPDGWDEEIPSEMIELAYLATYASHSMGANRQLSTAIASEIPTPFEKLSGRFP